jgi:hypothetical protein
MARGKVRHFELSHPSLHDIFVRIAAPAEQDAKDEGATEENEENHHA